MVEFYKALSIIGLFLVPFVIVIITSPNLVYQPDIKVGIIHIPDGNHTLANVMIENTGTKPATGLIITMNPAYDIIEYGTSHRTEEIDLVLGGSLSLIGNMERLANQQKIVIDTILNVTDNKFMAYTVYVTHDDGSTTYHYSRGQDLTSLEQVLLMLIWASALTVLFSMGLNIIRKFSKNQDNKKQKSEESKKNIVIETPIEKVEKKNEKDVDYDIFVSYDDVTGNEHAEVIKKALKRRGYKVFVAHLEKISRTGKYRKYIDKIILKSKTFIFINTYDALTRDEIIREFNQGFPKGDLSPRNLWIFKKNEDNVPYDSHDFNQRTNIVLSDQNQVPFNSTTELGTHVLSNCDQKNFEKTVVIEPIKKNENLSETQKKDYSESNETKIFAREFKNRGYEIDFERKIGNYLSADLILRKDDKWILCEFKTNAEKISNTVFSQILKYKNELEHIEKDISIELWLIGKGNFRSSLKNEAKKFNIKVIDDSNIHEVLDKELVYISVPKSIISYGESINVRISVDEIKDEPLKLIVKNEVGKIIHEKSFKIQTTDWLEYTITAEGKAWEKAGERFSIIAEYGEQSVLVTIWRSNFGATIELDQKVYTWTDKVYITLVAPDFRNHEFLDVDISTKQDKIKNYKLEQTGVDTGIFTGEISLSGLKKYFTKEKRYLKDFLGTKNDVGPSNGLLPCGKNDAVQVSFKLSEKETVIGSALVRWNIGEVQWLDDTYSSKGKGRIRVVDPDMNLNANTIDNVEVRIWSDTDALGKSLTLYETNVNTGIFEGDINFDPKLSDESVLKVSEGDTITVEYVDYTLPDPYTSADELNITGTAVIGKKILYEPKLSFKQSPKKVVRISMKENFVIIPSGSSVPGCEETEECYIPSFLEIKLNEKVTWKNKDSAAHTITSGTPKTGPDGEFDSSLFMSGTTFSHRFTKKGEFPYFDLIHPWQRGKIVVK